MTCYQPPPPAPPAMLYRLAYAVLGVAMLAGLLAAMFLAGQVAAIVLRGVI